MTILSPSGLETDTYDQAGWHAIMNKNFDMLNRFLLKVQALGDIDTDNLRDGAILTWDNIAQKWKCKTYG